MKTAGELGKWALWLVIGGFVASSVLLDAMNGGKDEHPNLSRFAAPPPNGGTIAVGDAVRETPPVRKIAPLALAEPPSNFKFVFSVSIDASTRAEIRGEAALAVHYFQATGGGAVGPVTVNVADDPKALSEMYRNATHSSEGPGDSSFWSHNPGVYNHGSVYLLLSSGGSGGSDDEEDTSSNFRARINTASQAGVIHELAHALDDILAAYSSTDGIPIWLVEGSAEVEAYTALDAFGFRSYESERGTRMTKARRVPTTLAATDDTDISDVYTLGFLAVDRLTASGDLAPLRRFWAEFGKSADWRASFEGAFGTTPEAFESSFEGYRSANFPRFRGEVRGNVRGADGDHVVRVWACGDGRGGCALARTDAQGNFLLVVPDDRYKVEFQVQPVGTSKKSAGAAPIWFYVVGGVTQKSDKAAAIAVYDGTVTGVDVTLASLQASDAAP